MSIRFLSRAPVFRNVDDTLGVIYTHGIAGLVRWSVGWLLRRPASGRVLRRGQYVEPARQSERLQRRQLDAVALAGRDRPVGDRLQRHGDVHPAQAGRASSCRCVSPTRSSRSAITRSTATRSTPPTYPPLGGRTPRRGSPFRLHRSPRWAARRRYGSHRQARHPLGALCLDAIDCGPASAGPQALGGRHSDDLERRTHEGPAR